VALINKLVRRYLRWYINPIVEQQNAYNDAVARALRLLADAYADLGDGGRGTGDGEAFVVGPSESSADTPIQELMALVRERAQAEPPARFPDLELRALEPQLGLREQVSAHWPLHARTSPLRAVALINKLVRRYLRWYVNPIVEQQNGANAAITAALLAMIRLDAERRAQVAALRASDKMEG
jgi:hypothetical protein